MNCSEILIVNSGSGPITCYENNKNCLYSTTFNIVSTLHTVILYIMVTNIDLILT